MGFFKDFFAERILPHPQMLRHSLLQKQNNFARILHRRNAKRPQTLVIKGLRALLLSGPERTRTSDARFRKPTLYPLSYGAVNC